MVDWSQAFKTLNRAAKLRQIKELSDELDELMGQEKSVDLIGPALESKPEEPKGVVIPKTCIALYSEEHAQATLPRKVQIMDTGERLVTHVCPPEDAYAYKELYPDAYSLGIVIGGAK